eukprot:GEMP01042491.1.p1 GENE.GEMP01042491.1~~GEMP01042491.1.p1  ORF type:complete len:147 (+),score=18.98 GEMP01042491.1:294-734(+)
MTSYIATVRVALFLLLTSVTVQGRDAGNTAPRRLRRLRAAIDNSSVAAIAQFTEDACNAAQEYRCPSGPQRCKETLYWNRTAGRCDLVKAESQNRSGGNPADGVRDYEFLRVGVLMLCLITFIMFLVCGVLAYKKWNEENKRPRAR